MSCPALSHTRKLQTQNFAADRTCRHNNTGPTTTQDNNNHKTQDNTTTTTEVNAEQNAEQNTKNIDTDQTKSPKTSTQINQITYPLWLNTVIMLASTVCPQHLVVVDSVPVPCIMSFRMQNRVFQQMSKPKLMARKPNSNGNRETSKAPACLSLESRSAPQIKINVLAAHNRKAPVNTEQVSSPAIHSRERPW